MCELVCVYRGNEAPSSKYVMTFHRQLKRYLPLCLLFFLLCASNLLLLRFVQSVILNWFVGKHPTEKTTDEVQVGAVGGMELVFSISLCLTIAAYPPTPIDSPCRV